MEVHIVQLEVHRELLCEGMLRFRKHLVVSTQRVSVAALQRYIVTSLQCYIVAVLQAPSCSPISPISPYLHQLVLRQRRRAHHRRKTADKLRNQPKLDENKGGEDGKEKGEEEGGEDGGEDGGEEGGEEGEPPMLVRGAVCVPQTLLLPFSCSLDRISYSITS